MYILKRSQNVLVSIAMDHGLDGQGSIPGKENTFFSSPQYHTGSEANIALPSGYSEPFLQ
jgi:hypothetical protein